MSIELTTLPHACFSVQLENPTLKDVQEVLEQAYLTLLANPTYLFCSEQGFAALNADIAKNTVIPDELLHQDPTGIMEMSPTPGKLVAIRNIATGGLVRLITLPDLEPAKLLFGFVDFSYPPPPSVDPRLIGRY